MMPAWWLRLLSGRTPVAGAPEPAGRPDAAFEAAWRPQIKSRLLLICTALAVWAVAIEAQLIHLQVYSHASYVETARRQQQEEIRLSAMRGDILDRHGELLASSVEGHRLTANPRKVKERGTTAEEEAREICDALPDCTAAERRKFTEQLSQSRGWTRLRSARQMSPDATAAIEALRRVRLEQFQEPVVYLEPEPRRYYPKLDLASHVLGFVNAEGKGGGGIEARLDEIIAGTDGVRWALVDAGGREVFTRVVSEPVPGASVELTIDLSLQHVAERELAAAVRASRADAGVVVAMDPYTGELLALASYLPFNPNLYGRASENELLNRALQAYEPGSTFKMITAAAAISEGLLSPTDVLDTNPGTIQIPGRKPITEVRGANYGALTLEQVLIKSSNVGAIKTGQMIGADRMIQVARRFGFGQRLLPDLAGESAGQVKPTAQVTPSALASISMGYEIMVTPLQVAAAASAIANGGLLVEPRLLRAVIQDGRRQETVPKVLRRVLAPDAAETVTAMMESVVANGSARTAGLERYRVAGKTGTAAKIVNRRYSTTDYNVSFVGFVPSRAPAITIVVVIDTPRAGEAFGSTIAAPVFRRIAEAAMQRLAVPPSINPAPPIIKAVAPMRPAVRSAKAAAIAVSPLWSVDGSSMPDLRGLSVREALRLTNAIGLEMTVYGEGVVAFQTPAAGSPLPSSGFGAIRLRRVPGSASRNDR